MLSRCLVFNLHEDNSKVEKGIDYQSRKRSRIHTVYWYDCWGLRWMCLPGSNLLNDYNNSIRRSFRFRINNDAKQKGR